MFFFFFCPWQTLPFNARGPSSTNGWSSRVRFKVIDVYNSWENVSRVHRRSVSLDLDGCRSLMNNCFVWRNLRVRRKYSFRLVGGQKGRSPGKAFNSSGAWWMFGFDVFSVVDNHGTARVTFKSMWSTRPAIRVWPLLLSVKTDSMNIISLYSAVNMYWTLMRRFFCWIDRLPDTNPTSSYIFERISWSLDAFGCVGFPPMDTVFPWVIEILANADLATLRLLQPRPELCKVCRSSNSNSVWRRLEGIVLSLSS